MRPATDGALPATRRGGPPDPDVVRGREPEETSPVIALDAALLTPGELLVGVDEAPPAPLNFGTPAGRDFRGFEVDLIEAIAGRLGLRAAYRSARWSDILADLAARRLDAVCGAATVTDDRRRAVEFSDPYLDVLLALVVRAGDEATGVEAVSFARERAGCPHGAGTPSTEGAP
jgi:ABC-type amino acid transport substrate-binding protein